MIVRFTTIALVTAFLVLANNRACLHQHCRIINGSSIRNGRRSGSRA